MSKTNLCMFISCFHVGCYRTPEKGRSKTPFILFFFFFFFFFLRGGEFRNTAEGMTLFVVVFLCLFLFLHNVFIVSIPPPPPFCCCCCCCLHHCVFFCFYFLDRHGFSSLQKASSYTMSVSLRCLSVLSVSIFIFLFPC